MTMGCGQIDTNNQSTSFVINYHLVGVIGIIEFRKRTIDDRAVGVEDRMQNAHAHKIHNNSLQKKKKFEYLIFVGGATHKNFLTMKISRSTVIYYDPCTMQWWCGFHSQS